MRSLITSCVALSILLMWTPSAFSQVVALKADFNQETPGELPALNPPGDPAGDLLQLRLDGGTAEVRTDVGAMTDQPLWLNREVTGSFWFAGFLDPDLTGCETYTVSWTSMVSQYTFFYSIVLRGTGGFIIGSPEFRANGAMSYLGSGNPLSVGYQPNTPQDFEITVDMVGKTSSLSINGVAVPEAQDMNFGASDFTGIFFSPGGNDFYEIVVDDLEVVASVCPQVAVEPTTWGTIKARYP